MPQENSPVHYVYMPTTKENILFSARMEYL